MADTLEKRIAERDQAQTALARANNELEERVAERTAELSSEVSERKQTEAELNAYFNAAPLGMVLLDPQLRYLKANQRLTEMTRVAIDARIGKTVREISPSMADILEPVYQRGVRHR